MHFVDFGDTVLEVGANIGTYTVPLADAVGPTGFVYAFEPFRKIFQIMTANCALNGLSNVQTYQAGAGNRTQVVKVRAPDFQEMSNLGTARIFYQQESHVVPF